MFYAEVHTDQTGGYFVPWWTLRDDVRMNSFRACWEMIDHLATPAKQEALSELNKNQLLRQAYVNVGSGVALLAELFKRFSQLNRDYRELEAVHQGCSTLTEKLQLAEEEHNVHVEKFEALMKEFRDLEDEVAASSVRTDGLTEQLEEMEKDRKNWMKVASNQASQIKELEKQLGDKSLEVGRLTKDNKQLLAELASSEVVRHNIVKELVPAAFHRLFSSAEYKKILGRVYSLSYTGGFIVVLGLKERRRTFRRYLGR